MATILHQCLILAFKVEFQLLYINIYCAADIPADVTTRRVIFLPVAVECWNTNHSHISFLKFGCFGQKIIEGGLEIDIIQHSDFIFPKE